MTEFELHELINETIVIAENNFEFWLTASFAVLVAGYFAVPNLLSGFQRIVFALYGLVSLVFLIRWLDMGFLIRRYSMELVELGGSAPGTVGTNVAFVLQTLILIFGTIATICFLQYRGRDNNADR